MIRRYAAEFIGTFLIVAFGCGSIATITHGGVAGSLAVNAVFGLTVAAAVYALGHISAAHFNPAVSIAFAVAKRFPWRQVPMYIAAQTLGAVAGSGVHWLAFADRARAVQFGATIPAVPLGACLTIEVLLTFFLMLVVISVATDRRVDGAVPGLAIGMTVTLCGLFGGPLTGCSMNPARSLGPALFAGGPALTYWWIYLVGPVAGAVGAAVIYELIRGGDHHGQNAPNDIETALERITASSI